MSRVMRSEKGKDHCVHIYSCQITEIRKKERRTSDDLTFRKFLKTN